MFLFKLKKGQLKGQLTPKNKIKISYDVCLLWNIMKLDGICSKSPKNTFEKTQQYYLFQQDNPQTLL